MQAECRRNWQGRLMAVRVESRPKGAAGGAMTPATLREPRPSSHERASPRQFRLKPGPFP